MGANEDEEGTVTAREEDFDGCGHKPLFADGELGLRKKLNA